MLSSPPYRPSLWLPSLSIQSPWQARVVINTDISGVYTADPRIVKDTYLYKALAPNSNPHPSLSKSSIIAPP